MQPEEYDVACATPHDTHVPALLPPQLALWVPAGQLPQFVHAAVDTADLYLPAAQAAHMAVGVEAGDS